MKKLFFFIALLLSGYCYGQNYQCLQSGVKPYFINANGYLRGMRIDSTLTLGDTTVYYPYRTPRGYYGDSITAMLDSTGGSWLGKRVLQLSDGTFIFDDLWKDSVIIKTQAGLSESWVFYRDSSTLYYTATVISIDTMTVAGTLDTVKTIEINAYIGTSLSTADSINGFQMLLSKNHGFVQVFDLFTFPYHTPGATYIRGLDYFLDKVAFNGSTLGLSDINSIFRLTIFHSPTFEQLYQWNVGDVYEYNACSGCTLDPRTYEISGDRYDMDTITVAAIATAGETYSFQGWQAVNTGYRHYTITPHFGGIYCDTTLLIDTTIMPEEYQQHYNYYYLPDDTSYCLQSPAYTIVASDIRGERYNSPWEWTDATTSYKYLLGITNYYENNDFVINSQKLLFYNRAGGECGSVHVPPTGVTNINSAVPSYQLFPNPSDEELHITSMGMINDVYITDLVGKVVYARKYASVAVTVDVRGLPPGI